MITPGMETATFQLVSQCLYQLRHRGPQLLQGLLLKFNVVGTGKI
jgi:hypothetical protein